MQMVQIRLKSKKRKTQYHKKYLLLAKTLLPIAAPAEEGIGRSVGTIRNDPKRAGRKDEENDEEEEGRIQ